ncbi:hypothetical protein [Streptomyces sp. CBMA123]|uniref:hypothetical protein n=1 Tax=Streptomyces sp. CBMA123 TaxID=1896313 RepID=UPI001661B157|nr:hypothetical protein [Streptomyces sp. CBMA123]MBD0689912.1 hypothetical protein [Streptomyces sp. CBMA123]
MPDEPLDLDLDEDEDENDEDEDAYEDDPWIVAYCPVGPELAAQLVEMAELDWTDDDAGRQALTDAGWRSRPLPDDLDGTAYTPAGHVGYGDDCLFLPFAYEYYVHPAGAMAEDFWGTLPGWQRSTDQETDTFNDQLDAVAAQFTTLLGPPDHDVSHDRRPHSNGVWRYRVWRRGSNALVVAPGLDPFSYSQFEHAFIQIRPLPADAPLPPADELPDFFIW